MFEPELVWRTWKRMCKKGSSKDQTLKPLCMALHPFWAFQSCSLVWGLNCCWSPSTLTLVKLLLNRDFSKLGLQRKICRFQLIALTCYLRRFWARYKVQVKPLTLICKRNDKRKVDSLATLKFFSVKAELKVNFSFIVPFTNQLRVLTWPLWLAIQGVFEHVTKAKSSLLRWFVKGTIKEKLTL